ncbi:hypothetical protein HYH02_011052 [Chlamydomonas schloesseri]|uniref:Protein kinase domain-containing protein n=1 Tax=Chlamydomonas schloesseri TaxID=2026947 RepID=A0A835T623_9CHLO|nr:hypothetical protein HYH02_011052 [Chlamydomonas schloesseri]|eukprot:KAG2437672.1 hypothetical protein HYH02_011052 [Chlamydomonas schloesseri]
MSYRAPNMASLVAAVLAAQAAGKLPAEPVPNLDLAVNQSGCTQNTSLVHPTLPILQRCWPNDIIQYTLPVIGQELNGAGVPEPTYYVWSIQHLFAPCMRQADEECVAQYGPIGCNAYAISNVPPLPIAAMEVAGGNGTGGGGGGTGGGGGGGSTTGIIVGCVVGGVVFALLVAGVLVAAVRAAGRRRRAESALYSTPGSSDHDEECLHSGGSGGGGERAGSCGACKEAHAKEAAGADGGSKHPRGGRGHGNGFDSGKDCDGSCSIQHHHHSSRRSGRSSDELPSAEGLAGNGFQPEPQPLQQPPMGTGAVRSGSMAEQAAALERQKQAAAAQDQLQPRQQLLLRAESSAAAVGLTVCGSPMKKSGAQVPTTKGGSQASAGVLSELGSGGSATFRELPPPPSPGAAAAAATPFMLPDCSQQHMPIIMPASPYRADLNFNLAIGSPVGVGGGLRGGGAGGSGAEAERGPSGACDTGGDGALLGLHGADGTQTAAGGAWRYNSMGSAAGSAAGTAGAGGDSTQPPLPPPPYLQQAQRNQQQLQLQIAALQAIKHQNQRRAPMMVSPPPEGPRNMGDDSHEPPAAATAAPDAQPGPSPASGEGPGLGPRQPPLLPPLPEERPSCELRSSATAQLLSGGISTITRVIVPLSAAQSIAAAAAGSSSTGGGEAGVWGCYLAAANVEAAAAAEAEAAGAAAAAAEGGGGGALWATSATYVSEDCGSAPSQHRHPPASAHTGTTSPPPSNASSGVAADTLELLPVVRGRGAFGRVVEGIYRGERVAVKMLLGPGDGAATGAQGLHDALRQEVEVLGRCSHPNVVKLLAACLDPRQPCLVMELCETSLEALIFKRGPQQQQGAPQLLPLVTVLGIAIDICNAISYLHPTVIHRDLKPANVLINGASSGAPVAKITDFGLSRLRAMTLPTKDPEAGTAAYMAPECFDVLNKFVTHHADLFSLGVIIWTMLTGQEPWKEYSVVVVAFRVCAKNERLPLGGLSEQRCPPKLRKIITDLWDADPRRRPAAEEVAKELMLLRQQLLAAKVEGRGSKDQ